MANATFSPKAVHVLALRALILVALTLTSAGIAAADTLIMPKRDGIKGESLVLWGVTTRPNHTVALPTMYKILVGSTVVSSGNVTDRSYINFSHTFNEAGTFTVTLEVKHGVLPAESDAVDVQIFDKTQIDSNPAAVSLPVGPHSNEIYRNLRKNMAIQDGLRYLWTAQTNRGPGLDLTTTNWGNQTWYTAMAVTAFENHGYRLANDGSAPTEIYERFIVQRGLTFIINNLEALPLSSKTTAAFGDPCVGIGIERTPSPAPPAAPTLFTCNGLTDVAQSDGYTVGIVMMPLAASSALSRVHGATGITLVQNKTYREILQRLANTYAFGQLDTAPHRGGWGYNPNDNRFDGSVMGWAILGLLDAQAANIVVPQWVEDELEIALNAGTINDNGSFDYNVSASNNFNTTHMSKAGIPLQGLFMVSREDDTPAVKQANADKIASIVTYIRNRWTFNTVVTYNGTNPQIGDSYTAVGCSPFFNKGCAYSMFNIFKGLKLLNIVTLPQTAPAGQPAIFRAAGPGIIEANDWHADYEDYLINKQVQGATGGDWAARVAAGGNPAIPVAMMFSPQGTNDNAANAAIAELLLAGVALVLPDADRFATVGLSASLTSLVEGGTVTLTATALSSEGAAVPGATVNFAIIDGLNEGAFSGTDVTDANGKATFTYTDPGPIPSFGIDTVRANIGTLLSNVVEINWEPFNRPPVANPDTFTVNEDGQLNGTVMTNDTDPDADDVLTAALVDDVDHGVLVLSTNGSIHYTPAADFCGTDSFTYDLNDGLVDGNVATVTINVTCVNDAPTAGDDSNATDEDHGVSGSVAANDGDIDSASLTWSKASDPLHGGVLVNGNGSYTYTPAPDYCGPDSFTYQVSDGALFATATVSIAVACINDAPVANDDSVSTNEDTTISNVVTGNDDDVDSASLAWTLISSTTNGTLAFDHAGSYVYTPNSNFCGSDSFSYKLNDGELDSNVATVTITVNCVNDAPVAADGSATTDEDTAVTGEVSSTDVDGGAPKYAVTTGPSHGTLVLNENTGTYTYTPAANYHGPDSFTFSVSDGNGGADTGDVTITVMLVNDAPVVAGGLTLTLTTILEDAADPPGSAVAELIAGAVVGGISDPDDASFSPDMALRGFAVISVDNSIGTWQYSMDNGVSWIPFGPVSQTSALLLDPSARVRFVPNADASGPATMTIRAWDQTSGTTGSLADASINGGRTAFSFTSATATIQVTPVNDPPVPNDSSDSTAEDTAGDGNAGATDVEGDTLSYVLTDPPDHGAVVFNADGSYIYTPAPDYNGPDSFSFSVSDGTETVPGGDVSFTVTAVNDPPVPNDSSDSTAEDTPGDGNVGATDPDGNTLTYVVTDPPDHGAVVFNADGSYIYTPAPDYNGPDSFSFSVSDGTETVPGGDVSFTVTAVNDPPVPNDSSDSTAEGTAGDGNAGATDVDGDTLSYVLTDPPDHGVVVFNADGSYIYTPAPNYNGPDSFSFSVSDGTETVPGGDVSFTVTAVNSPPVPNDSNDSTAEDTPGDGSVGATDPDGDTLTYVVTDPPDHGTVVLNPNDGSYVYTPDANYNGGDSFSFSVSDGIITVGGGDVTLIVTAVNDPPVPNDGSSTTAEDTVSSGSVGATDVDGDTLTYAVTDPPDHGTLVLNPNGTYVYTPAPDYNGPDSFSFGVSDGTVTVGGGDVSILTTPVNDLPVCTAAGPSIASLWPPNHELVDINVLGVTDPVEQSAISIKVTGIFQDEPTNTIGDGNTLIDGFGLGTSTAKLRRERSGSKKVPGDGRMYYINFTGTDADGGQCTGTVQVGVPHDLGMDNAIGAGGPLYKSTGQ